MACLVISISIYSTVLLFYCTQFQYTLFCFICIFFLHISTLLCLLKMTNVFCVCCVSILDPPKGVNVLLLICPFSQSVTKYCSVLYKIFSLTLDRMFCHFFDNIMSACLIQCVSMFVSK